MESEKKALESPSSILFSSLQLNSWDNKKIDNFITRVGLSKIFEDYKSQQILMRMFPKLNIDTKTFLMLRKTYYINLFSDIEKLLRNIEINNSNSGVISNNDYICLISYLYKLINSEKILISKEDNVKSLLLQKKIIEIMKIYVEKEMKK